MNDSYFVMHEDTVVGGVYIVDNNIVQTVLGSNADMLMPLGFEVSRSGLTNWLNTRGLPVTRNNIKVDLGSKIIFEYMLENLGLSLVDHYWLRPENLSITWGQVNLYSNSFRSSISFDLKNDMQTIAGKTNFVPSASLKGDLQKKWLIDSNGIRRLIKGNYNDTCRQSISEVLATEIHRRQNKFMYVPYELIRISNNGKVVIGCSCPNFTTLDTEFVPAIDICNMSENKRGIKKPNSMNWYEYYVQVCKSFGVDVRPFMDYMFMIDFIMTNTDRHLNNFGIIRNSHTLDFISQAPIFDSGNSMFYKSGYIPVDSGLLNIEVTSFKDKEIDMLKLVRDRSLVDISLLPDENYLYNLLIIDKNTSQENIERTIKAYKKKVQYLEDFQNGLDLWKLVNKRHK